MPTFRRRPSEITAVQWTGDNLDEVLALVDADSGRRSDRPRITEDGGVVRLVVTTAQGQPVPADPGEWIVPEAQPGRAYPIAPDVFTATYDEINGDDTGGPGPAAYVVAGWQMSVPNEGDPRITVVLRDATAIRSRRARDIPADPDLPVLAELDLRYAEALRADLDNNIATAKTVAGLAPLVTAAGGNVQRFTDELTAQVNRGSARCAFSALGGMFGGKGLFG